MRFASGSGVVAGAGGMRRSSWCRASGFSERTVGLIALAFFVQLTTGCLSNEYRIPGNELQRLAQTPPAIRGHHVHIVQSLGDRRSDAIPYRAPPPPPPKTPPPAQAQPPPRSDGADWPPAQGDGRIGNDGWNHASSAEIHIH